MNTTLGLLGFIVYIGIIILPFAITAIKKKRQLGKVWSGPIRAKLSIAGKPLLCSHCGQTQFHKREGILVTSWVAFFHFSCWNHSATCYTCTNCSHIEWFVRPKEENLEFIRDKRE